ncbi:DUF4843 domain-containing protein [Pedobacter nyackensis]|uniref:DUF4843 domain-containing protein n=1 Tax=Pedobacter nyackensis TaxID=475255 RepID=UPI00292D2370|nr:DUF4843 domain-containing protein [Pedobacter nyackensis]
MKRLLLLIYALVLLITSCSKDPGLSYTEKDGVYFAYSYMNYKTVIEYDSVLYSFGMLEETKMKDTAKLLVKLMGKAVDKDRFYRISIDADSSTAVEGLHYESVAPLQKFRANRLVDTLKVVVLRGNLGSSHLTREMKRIYFKIKQSDDFNVGINKGERMPLLINNYLSEPKWWETYLSSGLNYYHPEKWKVLMKFHDSFKNPNSDYPMDRNLVNAYFNSLRSYLDDNPTYDKETNERVLMDRLVK